jgi:serpin B
MLAALVGIAPPVSAQTTKPKTDADRLVAANNTFGFDLYQKLAAQPGAAGKNLLFSPHSIASALSMLMEGARADTARQLAAALHLPGLNESSGAVDLAAVHAGAQSLAKQFAEATADQGFQLFSANGLWIDRRFAPAAAFTQSLQQNFGLRGPITLDFQGGSAAARQTINDWSDQETHGKIKQILAADPSPQTSMVLANTVYMMATWFKPFDRKATVAKAFHVDGDPTHDVQAAMMNVVTDDNHPYLETDDCQMTLLWYGYWKSEGDTITPVIPAYMLLVLPKRIDGLAGVERSLTWEKLDHLTDGFGKAEVFVELPKFKMNADIDLKQMLGQLGATDVFDPSRADLSGIAPATAAGRLHVSSATHRTVIDVNEEGTEAAAESMTAATAGVPEKRAEFRADHPFLFYIIHRQTNAILFMGRVMQPAE